jgi:hypothetical protein
LLNEHDVWLLKEISDLNQKIQLQENLIVNTKTLADTELTKGITRNTNSLFSSLDIENMYLILFIDIVKLILPYI